MTEEDELTLKGFLDIHVMTASDDEGEEELWEVLTAMGYNKQLQLDQVEPTWSSRGPSPIPFPQSFLLLLLLLLFLHLLLPRLAPSSLKCSLRTVMVR